MVVRRNGLAWESWVEWGGVSEGGEGEGRSGGRLEEVRILARASMSDY